MAAETAMIHVRVDRQLKSKATQTLSKMGLSMSDVVRLLLTRIEADQALPFAVKVPNAETIAAMNEGERGEVTSFATIEELMAHLHADDEGHSPLQKGLRAGRKRAAPSDTRC